MPKFKDVELVEKMCDVASAVQYLSGEVQYYLRNAIDQHENVGEELDYFASIQSDLYDHTNSVVERPHETFEFLMEDLKEFDKSLLRLLSLRLRLAQETGIHLNVVDGREWTRLVEYSV